MFIILCYISLGYKPYLSKADLDTVKITAEGDLDLNDYWKIFEESIKDNKKWLTIGYRRSTDNYNELFKLYNRNRRQRYFAIAHRRAYL